MTDLEKLKAVLDDIGVKYEIDKTFSMTGESLIIFNDDPCVYHQASINFESGKFTDTH